MDTNYLTWKIKIQTCALQVNALIGDGDKKEWLPLILSTLKEINHLATSFGPYHWTAFQNPTSPPFRVPSASEDTLFESLTQALTALFGDVKIAGITRIEL